MRIKLFLILGVLIAVSNLHSMLAPKKLKVGGHSFQRFGPSLSIKYLDRVLFGTCHGIAYAELPQKDNEALLVVTDPYWYRMVYAVIKGEGDNKDIPWLKSYGEWGSGKDKFNVMRGVCIDTTFYHNFPHYCYLYVADDGNARVVRLKYDVYKEEISWAGKVNIPSWIGSLSRPRDVTCATVGYEEILLIIADSENHRLVFFKGDPNNGGTWWSYGSKGSRRGEFDTPLGVAIAPADEGYYVFVTDKGNKRVAWLWIDENWNVHWKTCIRLKSLIEYPFHDPYLYPEGIAVAPEEQMVYIISPVGRIFGIPYGSSILYLWEYINEGGFRIPRDIAIFGGEVGITEDWTREAGLQYFWVDAEVEIENYFPSFLDPSDPYAQVYIFFRLNGGAKVCSLKVYNYNYTEIKNVLTKHMLPAGGTYHFVWDGKDSLGNIVGEGIYHLVIRVVDMYGEEEDEDYIIHEEDTVDVEVGFCVISDFPEMTAWSGGNRTTWWDFQNAVYMNYTGENGQTFQVTYSFDLIKNRWQWRFYSTLGEGAYPATVGEGAYTLLGVQGPPYSAWLSSDKKHIILEGEELPVPEALQGKDYSFTPPDIDGFLKGKKEYPVKDTLYIVSIGVVPLAHPGGPSYPVPCEFYLVEWRVEVVPPSYIVDVNTSVLDIWEEVTFYDKIKERGPSIACDLKNVYIAWEKNHDIWAIERIPEGYHYKINLTEEFIGGDCIFEKPSVDVFGNAGGSGVCIAHCGSYNIVYRAYPILVVITPQGHQWVIPEIDTVYKTTHDIDNPSIEKGIWVLWQEKRPEEGEHYGISGRLFNSIGWRWKGVEKISSSENESTFPVGEVWNVDEFGIAKFSAWTEKLPNNLFLLAKKLSLPGEPPPTLSIEKPGEEESFVPVPFYYMEGGRSYESPFTLFRDTFKTEGLISRDYGSDSLVYFFPWLSKNKNYGLMIEFYEEEGDSLKFLLEYGEQKDTIVYYPGEIERKFIILPKEVIDREFLYVKLKDLSGEGVVCSRIIVWDYWITPSEQVVLKFMRGSLQKDITLYQPYPNPFSRSLNIKFYLSGPERVSIRIYNVVGRMVKRMDKKYKKAGYYIEQWRGEDDAGRRLPSGIYFVMFKTKRYKECKKVILLR